MNEAMIFEADQRHGDQPVTPPAAVPERGEFERVINLYKTSLDMTLGDTIRMRIIDGHNRDMSEARKRIEEMERRLRVMQSWRDTYYNCLKRMSGGRRIPEILKAFDRETERVNRIDALEAENAQLKADKAELVAAADEVLDAIWETENGFSDSEKYLHELIEKHKEEK